MKASTRPDEKAESAPLTPDQEAAVKATATWLHHFSRTLKTCRLYDAANPTVVRFRQELIAALQQQLDQHGAMVLTFTAEDVLSEGVSLYPAKSRDDNLAFPFFRDGIRKVTLSPGFQPREMEALLDALLQVTGQNVEEDDLVTMLWQAHLPHLEIDYVPSEADTNTIADEPDNGVAWPETPEAAPEGADANAGESRSDDWSVSDVTSEIEAGFEALQQSADAAIQRFQAEYEAERKMPLVAAAIALTQAYLDAGAGREDRVEIARFVPRVLRQAFVQGNWKEAAGSLRLLEACGSPEWSRETFGQELLQPISVSSIRDRLESQEAESIQDFVDFARLLGEPSVDLLNQVLAETQNPKHQSQLAEAIAGLCRDNPERLAPWLSDPRWFVVRNIVQILGTIGGPSVVGLLEPLIQHEEPRVRQEVMTALRNVDLRHGRALLLRLLDSGDTRMFCSVLAQLAQERDHETAQMLLGYLLHSDFEKRSAEEKRAIYSALGTAGGDEELPELEAELHKGNWFNRIQESHRQAVARCIARIGTPRAREILERGAQSRRAPLRKACEDVLMRFGQA